MDMEKGACKDKKPLFLVQSKDEADSVRKIVAGLYEVIVISSVELDIDCSIFEGKKVLICPSNNKEGKIFSKKITEFLFKVSDEIKIIDVSDRPKGWKLDQYEGNWKTFKEWAAPRASVYQAPEASPQIIVTKENFNPNEIAALIQSKRKILFCGHGFFLYSGGCYKLQPTSVVHRWIKEILGDIFNISRTKEVIHSLSTDCYIEPKELNQQREYINVKNGLFNLNTFQVEHHREEVLSSIQLPVNYDPEAKCPLWEKTLDEIFLGDKNKIQTLQEFLGYCLKAESSQEMALLNIGEGANGKSLIFSTFQKIIGMDNYSSVPMECFGNRHYVAELFGKLVNITIESEAKAAIHDANFKAVVSGDSIEVDKKYQAPFKFEPFVRLIFAMNSLPRVEDKSDAFYRRLLILRYPRIFKEEEQDKQLKNKLAKEYDGIFIWLLEGLRRLEDRGHFVINDDMRLEIEEYRRENNNVLVFVEERCQINDYSAGKNDGFEDDWINEGHSSAGTITKAELYEQYKIFCGNNGYKPLGMKKFGKEIKKNFPKVREGRRGESRYWDNIRVLK